MTAGLMHSAKGRCVFFEARFQISHGNIPVDVHCCWPTLRRTSALVTERPFSPSAKLMSGHWKLKHSDIRRPVPAGKSATCGRGSHPYKRPVECGKGAALLCLSANERPKPGERSSCEHW
jgi:hypothetical protein